MDVNLNTLAEALRGMDRRKEEAEVDQEAKSALEVASGIGTETPMIVLRDVRRCILDLTKVMTDISEQIASTEKRAEQRHAELIASVQQITFNSVQVSNTPTPNSSRRQSTQFGNIKTANEYYYKDEEIKTGFRIVAVVLLQLHEVASKCEHMPDVGDVDPIMMDVKAWASAVTLVSSPASTVTPMKEKVQLPKLSSSETQEALDIVTSTLQGRKKTCRIEDIANLCSSCPGLISIVMEIAQRIVKCPGIIAEDKRLRVSHIGVSVVDRDGSLSVSRGSQQRANPNVLSNVPKLKFEDKKRYVSMILEDNMRPILALQKCRPD